MALRVGRIYRTRREAEALMVSLQHAGCRYRIVTAYKARRVGYQVERTHVG